ncbi:putative toxin-antitoxin system toxin component, PIN family [Magnetovirga frankeli]|uniref:putative toxin-antitoxin system toxin component, PIN family n=1 Tax=Magnetovirga frankeli TaxID=947516 RepID=UPI0012939B1D|nr:putative toxin-antitoxin system toxin component, PIN family [gamma proteobacterium SS-5]
MRSDIVLDTNVLLAALRSSRGSSFALLSLLAEDHFTLHVSVPLVAEYEAVLRRGQLELTDGQIDDVLDFLCARACHHEVFYLWRPQLRDPDDDFILELAVKAQASIVTWNRADFKRAQLFGIQVLTPADLLDIVEKRS